MIIHIALFQWKKDVSEEQIRKVLLDIKSLKDECLGIRNVFCGKNYHSESKNFTHAVVVVAKYQKSLDGYRRHSFHKQVAGFIEKMEEDGLGFDFEDM